MPRDPQTFFYIGIKSSVVAVDARTGAEVWRAKLKGSDFVTVLWDGDALLAANNGEVFRLDPRTGAVLWHNPLKGLGRGIVSLASSRAPTQSSPYEALTAKKRRDEQDAAAAAAAAS